MVDTLYLNFMIPMFVVSLKKVEELDPMKKVQIFILCKIKHQLLVIIDYLLNLDIMKPVKVLDIQNQNDGHII